MYALGLGWSEALLLGAAVASTDAAAVFFLLHARGLRLRPRVSATLEVEFGINDPFAIFLTIVLVEILLPAPSRGTRSRLLLTERPFRRAGRLCRRPRGGVVLNRLDLPQGLHAPFVATGALVVFGLAEVGARLGFPRGLCRRACGRQQPDPRPQFARRLPRRRHLAGADRACSCCSGCWHGRAGCRQHSLPALAVAFTLMFIARPAAVFLCLAPFRFNRAKRLFMSWVGLRGAVGIFIASIPMLVGLPNAASLFRCRLRGRVGLAAGAGLDHRAGGARAGCRVAARRSVAAPRRARPAGPARAGTRRLRGGANSPYLRRGRSRPGRRPTLVVRDERVFSPAEAGAVREGDYVYFLAPPERAQALDRFFVDLPPPARPDPCLLGDFFVSGDATLGALSEIYGLIDRAGPDRDDARRLFRRAVRSDADRGRHACRSGPSRWSCTQVETAGSPRSACSSPSRSPERRRRGSSSGSASAARGCALRSREQTIIAAAARSECAPSPRHPPTTASTPKTVAIRAMLSASRAAPSATRRPRSIITTRSAKRAASVRSCTTASTAPPARAARAAAP